MHRLPTIVIVCAFSCAAVPSLPAATIWDNIDINGGVSPTATSYVSQRDSGFGFDGGAADDFILPVSSHPNGDWSVTGIQWAGKFSSGNPVQIDGFNIIFWPTDAGTMPAGGTAGGPPEYAQAVAIYSNVPAISTPIDGLDNAFDYSAMLPSPFFAQDNRRYWIEIQAVVDYPPLWHFHATVFRRLSKPFLGFDLVGTPFWTPSPANSDLAFQLLGEPLPEPAAIGLMALGSVVLYRLRRIR